MISLLQMLRTYNSTSVIIPSQIKSRYHFIYFILSFCPPNWGKLIYLFYVGAKSIYWAKVAVYKKNDNEEPIQAPHYLYLIEGRTLIQ